jgi:hypothetical protein
MESGDGYRCFVACQGMNWQACRRLTTRHWSPATEVDKSLLVDPESRLAVSRRRPKTIDGAAR